MAPSGATLRFVSLRILAMLLRFSFSVFLTRLPARRTEVSGGEAHCSRAPSRFARRLVRKLVLRHEVAQPLSLDLLSVHLEEVD